MNTKYWKRRWNRSKIQSTLAKLEAAYSFAPLLAGFLFFHKIHSDKNARHLILNTFCHNHCVNVWDVGVWTPQCAGWRDGWFWFRLLNVFCVTSFYKSQCGTMCASLIFHAKYNETKPMFVLYLNTHENVLNAIT